MTEAFFRLARHELPDGSCHFDLFILVPGADVLLTYEISDHVPEKLREMARDPESPPVLLSRPADEAAPRTPEDAQNRLLARKKGDHRLLYWDFTGPIEGDRGFLSEESRGLIRGELNESVLELVLE